MKIDGEDQRLRSHRRSVSAGRRGFVRGGRATGFTESLGRAETPGCGGSRRRRPQLDGKIRPRRSPSLIRSAINFHLIPINCAAAVSTWTPGSGYYCPLGVKVHRGTRATLPSVSLSQSVLGVAAATDVTRNYTKIDCSATR